MNTTRSLRVCALLCVLAMVTIGCTATAPPPAAVELVWMTGDIRAEVAAPDVAAVWNEQHPDGPRVRVEALHGGADEQRQLLAVELNAGLPTFDVFDLDVIFTGEFAERGWLLDLEKLRSKIEDVTLPTPLNTAVWDDTLWAAPYTTDVGLLYYRSDLVPAPPTSWAELTDMGQRIAAEQGIAPFVADGRQYEGLTVQYLEYLWGAGGELLDTDDGSVALEQGPAQRAVEFMRTAYDTGFYAPGFDTMDLELARETFQSGGAVFMRSWPYAYKLMNGPDPDPLSNVVGKVGIAALPTFDGTGTTPALGGHGLAVNRYSGNPDAAVEFVEFVATSPEVQRMLAKEHSLAPTLRSVYEDPADDPMDPLMPLLARVLPQARPRPPSPEWPSITKEIQQQVFTTYTGKKMPAQAVNDLRSVLAATTEAR